MFTFKNFNMAALQKKGGKLFRQIPLNLGVGYGDFCEKLAEILVSKGQISIHIETAQRYMDSLPQKYILGKYPAFKASLLETVDYFCTKSTTANQISKRWEESKDKLLIPLDEINDKAVKLSLSED